MPVYNDRQDQLGKIHPHKCGTFRPQIKITQCVMPGATNNSPKRFHETEWMELTDEMASSLVKWLKENYTITE